MNVSNLYRCKGLLLCLESLSVVISFWNITPSETLLLLFNNSEKTPKSMSQTLFPTFLFPLCVVVQNPDVGVRRPLDKAGRSNKPKIPTPC